MSVYPIQSSFTSGELSPAMWGRIDLKQYALGLRECQNFIVHPHGGVSSRAGMRFIARAKGHCRLVTFQFNTEQAYVLEFGEKYVRFYRNRRQILNASNQPYEVATPYTLADVQDLSFAQSADVLFIVHERHAPRELVRLDHAQWTLSPFDFFGGPFRTRGPEHEGVTLTLSAASGNAVTMTANKDIFTADHVGSVWALTHKVPAVMKQCGPTWANAEVTVYKDWRVESNGFWYGTVQLEQYDEEEGRWVAVRTYTSVQSVKAAKNYADQGTVTKPTLLRLTSTSFNAFQPEGNVPADKGYFLLESRGGRHTGYARIMAVTNAKTATVKMETPAAMTVATKNWQEGAWCNLHGWPSAVGFYQERIVFGGSTAMPQTVWMSRTGDYNDFAISYPLQDDDAVAVTLAARQINAIRHMISLGDLMLLTSGSEWRLAAGPNQRAVTPKSVSVTTQSYTGSSSLDPIVIGEMVLHVQSQGSRVRDLSYSFESDSYTGNDLTVMASHLLRGHKILDWAYQQDPDSTCWIVRDDGLLLALTYLREHEVVAWARHPTDGTVMSVASVNDPAGDVLYLAVSRKGVHTVECLAPQKITSATDAFHVDSGVTYRGKPVTTVTGLDHLEGRVVSILADGSEELPRTVSGGKITLGVPAKVVHIGLPYKPRLRTLDLMFPRDDGAQLGRYVRLSSVRALVENTRGLWFGVDDKHMMEHIDRRDEPYGTQGNLLSGLLEIRLSSGYDRGSLIIEERSPLPCTILALMSEADPGA